MRARMRSSSGFSFAVSVSSTAAAGPSAPHVRWLPTKSAALIPIRGCASHQDRLSYGCVGVGDSHFACIHLDNPSHSRRTHPESGRNGGRRRLALPARGRSPACFFGVTCCTGSSRITWRCSSVHRPSSRSFPLLAKCPVRRRRPLAVTVTTWPRPSGEPPIGSSAYPAPHL